ncbi:trypsin 5G1-like [Trichoplusia ni]|uniref:trypsin n=1 Tax=Trichoplusia ni TaxID=7111 RepID=A0A7E5W8E9_TRINI|nr:trypsin 5G1-like [Trichoplusia ni]
MALCLLSYNLTYPRTLANDINYVYRTPYSLNLISASPGLFKPHNVGIIGGHSITIDKAPYIASLRLNGTHHWCGGSIIHERFVMTAAHCIVPNREFKVLVGTDKVDEGGKLYDVEKKIIHPKYNNLTSDYDICILRLNESLSFSTKVNKIALNDRKVRLRSRTMLNATGWGYTQPEGKISQYLRQVTIPVVESFSCQLVYGLKTIITKRMFCAGGNGKDTCMGDSGGPLTKDNVQVGLTSFGAGCGKIPGVYTKISVLHKWIKKTINQNFNN